MAERPPYSSSYDHLNYGFPHFPEVSAPPYLQSGDHPDQYFPQPQPNFIPHNPFYEKPPEHHIENFGPVYPYFRDSRPNFYAPQGFNGQNRNVGSVKQSNENQHQTPKGNFFPVPVNLEKNPNIGSHQSPPGNQHASFCPSEQAQTEQNDLEENEGSNADSESSKKNGGIINYKSIINSKIWDEEMDELLLKLGPQYKCNWKRISKKYNHKKITPAFIKMRYKELSSESPMTRRIKFTHREDLMIAKYFDKFGSNWSKMTEFFPDRTAIMLKNRYYSFIRKKDVLDLLLSKVMNLENQSIIVDSLETLDSGKYTECIDLKQENLEFSQNQVRQQVVFNFEGTKPAESPESTAASQQTFDRDLEIKFLQARVKSLQTLYVRAKTQLDQQKTKT